MLGSHKEPDMTMTVWIDHQQAIITPDPGRGPSGPRRITRAQGESEDDFDLRVVDAVIDHEHVEVLGPAYARTRFERAFVRVTHRPDLLSERDGSVGREQERAPTAG
jgi:hypothetical protein